VRQRDLKVRLRTMRSGVPVLVFLLAGILVTLARGAALEQRGAAAGRPEVTHLGTRLPCRVERIVDGDTLVCVNLGRVRLLLIDTPELDQEPFGQMARDALAELVPPGSEVQLETDVQTHDRYGRLLAYLHLEDGRIVNEEVLAMGMAVVLVYPPNIRHVDRFRAAVERAREEKRGLWETEAFSCLPVDHRSGRC